MPISSEHILHIPFLFTVCRDIKSWIRNPDLKIFKNAKKQGLNLGVKRDKLQPVIYHLLMDMLKKQYQRYQSNLKFLQFDVMKYEINDCLEMLVITVQVSLYIL